MKNILRYRYYKRKFSSIFVDFFKKMLIINTRMDTFRTNKSADPAACGTLQEQKTVVGVKQLKKALEKGQAKQVFLAENADPALTGPILELCRACRVQCAWVATMAELGRACGIDVGAAAAAVVKDF